MSGRKFVIYQKSIKNYQTNFVCLYFLIKLFSLLKLIELSKRSLWAIMELSLQMKTEAALYYLFLRDSTQAREAD